MTVLKPVVVETTLDCSTAVGPLWNAVTDTEYLNRVSGRASLTLTPIEGGGAARYRVATRAGGFRVEWDEAPFEWTLHRSFRVRRRMLKGPVAAVDTHFAFEPVEGGGTRLTLGLELTPK